MSTPRFDFSDHIQEVDIAGNLFKMNCSTKTGDFLQKVGANLRSMATDLKSGKITEENVIDYCKSVFDTILGQGATDTIFSGRERTIDDASDLLLYLTQVARSYQENRRDAITRRIVMK